MIARCSGGIYTFDREDPSEVDSISFDNPALFYNLCFTCDIIVNCSLAVYRTAGIEDFRNFFKAAKSDLLQNLVSKLSEGQNNFLAFLISDIVRPDSDHLRTSRGVVRVYYLNAFLVQVWVQRVVNPIHYISLELKIVIEYGVRWGAIHLEAE